ncbi:MAG: O-methyltransferase [Bacteroidota bacterium]
MDFLPRDISAYVEAHTTEPSGLLSTIDHETHEQVLMPRMLSGHLQGRLLSMISKIQQPKSILEIGTYTGYSTICLAEGLSKEGNITTLDINEELESRVKQYFEESGFNEQINFAIGNALELIPKLNANWDLVFIDADKVNYGNYYDLVIDRLNPGGVIIADNVLWSGKVIEERRKKLDKDTKALIDFNKKVHEDNRVENVLLPIRDGLMMLRKNN